MPATDLTFVQQSRWQLYSSQPHYRVELNAEEYIGLSCKR